MDRPIARLTDGIGKPSSTAKHETRFDEMARRIQYIIIFRNWVKRDKATIDHAKELIASI